MEIVASLASAISSGARVETTPVQPIRNSDELAAEQFRQVMSMPSPALAAEAVSAAESASAAKATIAPAVDETSDKALPAAPAPLGETILNGLQNLSSEYEKQAAALNQALQSSNEISVSDMLRAQSALMQVTLHHELVGKFVADGAYYIDELIKIQ
jgi:type III secretion protein I